MFLSYVLQNEADSIGAVCVWGKGKGYTNGRVAMQCQTKIRDLTCNNNDQRLFYSPLVWGKWEGLGRPSDEGAIRVEAPQVPRRMGCEEGVFPSPLGKGSTEGEVPLPLNFFSIFGLQIATFIVII